MMNGLAASLAQPQQQQPQQQSNAPSLEEVVKLLLSGVKPEDLESQGIPPELIIQAIDIIKEKMEPQQGEVGEPAAQEQKESVPMGGGLAQQIVEG